MKHSTGKATKANIARFERFMRLGCICCRQHGVYSVPEVHHILSGNRRVGHQATLPLCPHHHRAVGKGLGPSLAKGSKPFHAMYGSDQELLAKTNALIKEGYVK